MSADQGAHVGYAMDDDYFQLFKINMDSAEANLTEVRLLLSYLAADLKEMNSAFAKLLEEEG